MKHPSLDHWHNVAHSSLAIHAPKRSVHFGRSKKKTPFEYGGCLGRRGSHALGPSKLFVSDFIENHSESISGVKLVKDGLHQRSHTHTHTNGTDKRKYFTLQLEWCFGAVNLSAAVVCRENDLDKYQNDMENYYVCWDGNGEGDRPRTDCDYRVHNMHALARPPLFGYSSICNLHKNHSPRHKRH